MKLYCIIAVFILTFVSSTAAQSSTEDLNYMMEHFPSIKKMKRTSIDKLDGEIYYRYASEEGRIKYFRNYSYGRQKWRYEQFILSTETKVYTLSRIHEGNIFFNVKTYSEKTQSWTETKNVEVQEEKLSPEVRFIIGLDQGTLSMYR